MKQALRVWYNTKKYSILIVCNYSSVDIHRSVSVEGCVTFMVEFQFSLVQDGIYALGKARIRATPPLRISPSVAFETVPIFI